VRLVSTNRFVRIIETLCLHEVRFIVVGGVAAVLQRVPINTTDFDIIHDREVENVHRLLDVLAVLGATYRDDANNRTPTATELLGPESQLLRTGRLDLNIRSTLGDALAYADLLPDTDRVEVAGHNVDILKLEKLINISRQSTLPKDRFRLAHLEATLEERNRMPH
jgi:hypothetical protein